MSVLSESELIQIRRHLHQIPELALAEKETHDYLIEVIQKFKQDYLEVEIPLTLPTAILVLVKGRKPHRTIGYRADIDALPVTEKTGLAFSSKHEGVMHACGHDIHMTVALGLLSYFSENQPQDNLLFSFSQPRKAKVVGCKLMKKEFFMINLNLTSSMACMITPLCLLVALGVGWVHFLLVQLKSILIF